MAISFKLELFIHDSFSEHTRAYGAAVRINLPTPHVNYKKNRLKPASKSVIYAACAPLNIIKKLTKLNQFCVNVC